jgi:uncharacterized protein (TIGR02328 family)
MLAMEYREYIPDPTWKNWAYRGKNCVPLEDPRFLGSPGDVIELYAINDLPYTGALIYLEHTDEYLQECVNNLRTKGHFTNVDIRRTGAPDGSIVAIPRTTRR